MMKNIKLLTLAMAVLLLASLISAVGVVTPYTDALPLKISPGETKTVDLELQNMVGNEDITLRINLTDSQGIASISEKTDYLVPKQTKDTKVPVTITIPEDAAIGTSYLVKFDIVRVSSEQGAGATLVEQFNVKLGVLVEEKQEETESTDNDKGIGKIEVIIIVIVIILIAIVIKTKFLKKKD